MAAGAEAHVTKLLLPVGFPSKGRPLPSQTDGEQTQGSRSASTAFRSPAADPSPQTQDFSRLQSTGGHPRDSYSFPFHNQGDMIITLSSGQGFPYSPGRVGDSGSSRNQTLLGKGGREHLREMENGLEKTLENDPHLPIRMLLGKEKDP